MDHHLDSTKQSSGDRESKGGKAPKKKTLLKDADFVRYVEGECEELELEEIQRLLKSDKSSRGLVEDLQALKAALDGNGEDAYRPSQPRGAIRRGQKWIKGLLDRWK